MKILIRRPLRKTLKGERRVADVLHDRESLATTDGGLWIGLAA